MRLSFAIAVLFAANVFAAEFKEGQNPWGAAQAYGSPRGGTNYNQPQPRLRNMQPSSYNRYNVAQGQLGNTHPSNNRYNVVQGRNHPVQSGQSNLPYRYQGTYASAAQKPIQQNNANQNQQGQNSRNPKWSDYQRPATPGYNHGANVRNQVSQRHNPWPQQNNQASQNAANQATWQQLHNNPWGPQTNANNQQQSQQVSPAPPQPVQQPVTNYASEQLTVALANSAKMESALSETNENLAQHKEELGQISQDLESHKNWQDSIQLAQTTLASETEALKEQLRLMNNQMDALKLANQTVSLKEDFFYLNDQTIEVTAGEMIFLLEPFCIEGPSVFDFQLTASLENEVDSVMVSLMLNESDIVAQSQVSDTTAPSNLHLMYRGKIAEKTTVRVIMTSGDANTTDQQTWILPKQLQIGYKLYNEPYPFISELDTSCTV